MTKPFDPVLVEVINNELGAITEEMAVVIWRTGQSAQLKTGDFATAVCDPQGRVIGQGFAAPFQLAVFEELMTHVIARYGRDFEHGDVVITNDPFAGMGHMPDFGVVVPVVLDGRIAGFCISYSHHSDVGGRFPGSFSSEGRSSYEEGLRVPILKLFEAGRRNDAVLEIVRSNVRVCEEWQGDMEAKIAGCRRGADQLEILLRNHGWDDYISACEYVIDYAERSMRAAIGATPDGVYRAEYRIEDESLGEANPIEIRLALRIAGDTMVADFTGSSPQVPIALNSPLTMTKAGVYGALKCIIGPDLPTNCGFFRPIEVVAPPGSVLNPSHPAPVAGRAPVFFRVFDVIYSALAAALPGRIPVIGEGGDLLHFSTHEGDRELAFLDLYFGGWGGRVGADGIDGVAPVWMGSYGCASTELIEAQYPVVYDGFGFVPDSEGPGRYRGSLAIYRQWRFLSAGHAMVRNARLEPAAGIMGGHAGAPARTLLLRDGETITFGARTHIHLDVRAGDAIYHSTAGAGGYGEPLARDPDEVHADVRAGRVSLDGARERYGVVLDAAGRVDGPQTERLRAARAGSRVG